MRPEHATIATRVLYAVWALVVTPNAIGCGVQLVKFDDVITSEIQAVQEYVSQGAIGGLNFRKHMGHRLKGDGTGGPLVYMSRVQVLFEA